VLRMNDAAARFFRFLLGDKAPPRRNVLHMILDPDVARPYVANWDVVSESLLQRVQRESLGGAEDATAKALVEEVIDYPGVRERIRRPNLQEPLLPIIPVSFQKGDARFDFFSTVTTLGTPQDITVQEIRIECFFPVNDDTAKRARALASEVVSASA
jgi:hypothetical protein